MLHCIFLFKTAIKKHVIIKNIKRTLLIVCAKNSLKTMLCSPFKIAAKMYHGSINEKASLSSMLKTKENENKKKNNLLCLNQIII